MPPLVLASTSVYRRRLLGRFGVAFDVVAPGVDESPRADESPRDLAVRLARAKAAAVAASRAAAIVIGSDQVADLDGRPLGKPGSRPRAVEQLQAMRGRTVRFHTAVTVIRAATGFSEDALATVDVRFRALDDGEISRYLDREQPFDCAGSAKVESLGIALLESVVSDDPTALEGLPLIRTAAMLRRAGLDVLAGGVP